MATISALWTRRSIPLEDAGGAGEYLAPFGELAIGRDQSALVLIAPRDQFEHQIGMAIGVGEIADLVDLCSAQHKSTHVQREFMWSKPKSSN